MVWDKIFNPSSSSTQNLSDLFLCLGLFFAFFSFLCLSDVTTAEIAKIAVEFGMERIEQLTCVRFRERNESDQDEHYIYITEHKGYDASMAISPEGRPHYA